MKRLYVALFIALFSTSGMAQEKKLIHMYMIGTGLVGSTLLEQVRLKGKKDEEIRVVAVANSKVMLLDKKGIELVNWKSKLVAADTKMDLQSFVDSMLILNLPNSVFVDCTSSQAVANMYPQILKAKIPVVAANKKANSGSLATYRNLQNISSSYNTPFLYDANVGAGLPILNMVQSLRRSNDKIIKVEAVLSGTLSYIFNSFNGKIPFSQVVLTAQKKGFTEPDPREDMNAMDIARKILIIGRESGFPMEMSNIYIMNFLTKGCLNTPNVKAFYQHLRDEDQFMLNVYKQAAAEGKVLRFIATLENGKAKLGLQAVGKSHPFYHLTDTDNIISITSRYYPKSPIVIRGPGAGAHVTAAKVFANMLNAVHSK